MVNQYLSIIAAKNVPEKDILDAIRQIGLVTEPPQFWVSIANDAEYGMVHRRLCIAQLFRRHVPVGLMLSELGPRLKKPKWLRDGDVILVKFLFGKIPVQLTFEDTVVCIRTFPQLPGDTWVIYLRISGKIDRESILKALHGEKVDPKFRDAKVLEVEPWPPLVPFSST